MCVFDIYVCLYVFLCLVKSMVLYSLANGQCDKKIEILPYTKRHFNFGSAIQKRQMQLLIIVSQGTVHERYMDNIFNAA